MLVNAGGGTTMEADTSVFKPDMCYEGGNVFKTEANITDGGDYPSIYQSARCGNFSYKFKGLLPGDYFVDLHFVEIIYTNGPKGMRVFNVFVQEEKVCQFQHNISLIIFCIRKYVTKSDKYHYYC